MSCVCPYFKGVLTEGSVRSHYRQQNLYQFILRKSFRGGNKPMFREIGGGGGVVDCFSCENWLKLRGRRAKPFSRGAKCPPQPP